MQQERLTEHKRITDDLKKKIESSALSVQVWKIQDTQGNSLLNMTCLKNQTFIFRWLIKYAKEKLKEWKDDAWQADIIRSWVNKTNLDGFAPLHYASFNGNLEVCQMLIEEGADRNVTNNFGLNCLHTAAQGDQP